MKNTNGEFITNFPHTNFSKYLRPIWGGGWGQGVLAILLFGTLDQGSQNKLSICF